MGTQRVWVWVKFYTHGYGYGQNFVPINYMGIGMVLLYPAHTLPIAILIANNITASGIVRPLAVIITGSGRNTPVQIIRDHMSN
jgi:hypothetical protein